MPRGEAGRIPSRHLLVISKHNGQRPSPCGSNCCQCHRVDTAPHSTERNGGCMAAPHYEQWETLLWLPCIMRTASVAGRSILLLHEMPCVLGYLSMEIQRRRALARPLMLCWAGSCMTSAGKHDVGCMPMDAAAACTVVARSQRHKCTWLRWGHTRKEVRHVIDEEVLQKFRSVLKGGTSRAPKARPV